MSATKSHYAIQTITVGTEVPREDKPISTWQAGYARAVDLAATLRDGCLVDVVKRTNDASEYRLMARFQSFGNGTVGRWEL